MTFRTFGERSAVQRGFRAIPYSTWAWTTLPCPCLRALPSSSSGPTSYPYSPSMEVARINCGRRKKRLALNCMDIFTSSWVSQSVASITFILTGPFAFGHCKPSTSFLLTLKSQKPADRRSWWVTLTEWSSRISSRFLCHPTCIMEVLLHPTWACKWHSRYIIRVSLRVSILMDLLPTSMATKSSLHIITDLQVVFQLSLGFGCQ